jgi:hypothetical protein
MPTRRRLLVSILLIVLGAATFSAAPGRLSVSPNHRFLQQAGGAPFFWLGDTAWLLLTRPSRAEVIRFLDDRQAKGFNVLQVMVLHTAEVKAPNGALALVNANPGTPLVTPGSDPSDAAAYDYWDHLDWVLKEAAARGIYLALVPSWGSLVKSGQLNETNVAAYATFLAKRYRDVPNIVWLNGGDLQGDVHIDVWRALGRTIRAGDPNHLMTFHPFGRMQSSTWFHDEPWLDFNMFQSGHQTYAQDTGSPKRFGEDNWRFVLDDYAKTPPKPVLDGEPSYENIPQGLHDGTQPYWTDADARRYAYWSVFAGSFGHTYGNNAVMQFYTPAAGKPSYSPRNTWFEAMDDPGAGQMQHLKALMLSRPYFDRVYDAMAIVSGSGERYERLMATKGPGYLMVYTYTGRPFEVRKGAVSGARLVAWWFNPRDGRAQRIGERAAEDLRFTPPGQPGNGNDWVLVLDDAARNFAAPGRR